jgi:hypothetical protein
MTVDKQNHDAAVMSAVDLPDPEPTTGTADRRAFMMRSAVAGAVAVITGCSPAEPKRVAGRKLLC